MGPVYRFLGLTVGVIRSQQDPAEKRAAEWLGINRNTLRRKLLEHKLID